MSDSSGTLSTATAAAISANNGSLTLANTNSKSGAILIGAGSQIQTLQSGGNVNIVIGAISKVVGSPPSAAGTITYTVNNQTVMPPFASNTFFFGTNGIKVGTGFVNLVSNGAQVIFSTGALPSSAITVDGASSGSTVIKADPPISIIAPPTYSGQPLPVISSNSTQAAIAAGVSSPMHESLAILPNGYGQPVSASSLNSSLASASSAMGSSAISSSVMSLGISPSLSANSSLQANTLSAQGAAIALSLSKSVLSNASSIFESTNEATNEASNADTSTAQNLSQNLIEAELVAAHRNSASAVPSNSSPSKRYVVKPGAAVFASSIDSELETPFGTVRVDAGSVVLVITSSSTIAVYNLDDSHRDAVHVTTRGQDFSLYPGMSVLLTALEHATFEQLNPAESFSYRKLEGLSLGAGLKAFTSEFFVPGALQNVVPLRRLLSSANPESKRLVAHLLKTTAASLQLRGSDAAFQQIPHAATAAFLP